MRWLLLLFLSVPAFSQTACVGCPGGGGGSLGGSVNLTFAPTALSRPAAPTVTPTCSGTCDTEYAYELVARNPVGTSVWGSAAYPILNAAALDVTHYNTITPPACAAGQIAWDVRRDLPASPSGQNNIGTINCGATLVDTGLPQWSAINSPLNNSAGVYIDGALRSTGPLNSGPEYLLRAAQNVLGDGTHYAAVADTIHEDIIDATGNSFVESDWFVTAYNSNVANGIFAVPVGSCGIQGSYKDDGTKKMSTFQCRDTTDITSSNGLLGVDFFVASPKSGITTNALHFSQLDACGSTTTFPDGQSNEGSLKAVDDSTVATWGATITGGGSNHVLAYCNGTNWTVMAK